MKIRLMAFFCVCSYFCIYAQGTTLGTPTAGIDMNVGGGTPGYMTEITSSEVVTKGSVYLFDAWDAKQVSVNEKLIDHIQINYNLQARGFEYMDGGKIMRISSGKVDFVKDGLGNLYYESKGFKTSGGETLLGVLREIAAPAKWGVVAFYWMLTNEPTYNAALHAGSKATTYVRKMRYYMLKDNVLYEVVNNKKKMAEQFGSNSDKVLAFLKEKKIDLKEEKDLRILAAFLNEPYK